MSDPVSTVVSNKEVLVFLGGGYLGLKFLEAAFKFVAQMWKSHRANGEDPNGGGQLGQLFFKKMVEHLQANTEALTKCAEGLKSVLEHQEEERPLLERMKKQLDRVEAH